LAVNPVGGSGDPVRDGACTPKWLADLLPEYDVDPCSNPRSHIRAHRKYMLETGGDGLGEDCGAYYEDSLTVFCNPPYSRGQVIRWVHAWYCADFTFLLRWDPSTMWFSDLWSRCWGAWFPSKRMNFEPPPGVTFSSNPFPHAVYFANQPADDTVRALETRGYFVERRKPRDRSR
jgi:hypothetical protein